MYIKHNCLKGWRTRQQNVVMGYIWLPLYSKHLAFKVRKTHLRHVYFYSFPFEQVMVSKLEARMNESLHFLGVLIIWCVFFGYLAACLPLSLDLLLFGFAAGKLVFVVFFLPLHASVLKPDLHLSLGEGQSMRHFDAPLSGQVGIEQELLLQLQGLIATVGLSAPSPTGSCGEKIKIFSAWILQTPMFFVQTKKSFITPCEWSNPDFLKGCNSPVINRCHKAFNWG